MDRVDSHGTLRVKSGTGANRSDAGAGAGAGAGPARRMGGDTSAATTKETSGKVGNASVKKTALYFNVPSARQLPGTAAATAYSSSLYYTHTFGSVPRRDTAGGSGAEFGAHADVYVRADGADGAVSAVCVGLLSDGSSESANAIEDKVLPPPAEVQYWLDNKPASKDAPYVEAATWLVEAVTWSHASDRIKSNARRLLAMYVVWGLLLLRCLCVCVCVCASVCVHAFVSAYLHVIFFADLLSVIHAGGNAPIAAGTTLPPT